MGISEVTQICKNKKKCPSGSCSLAPKARLRLNITCQEASGDISVAPLSGSQTPGDQPFASAPCPKARDLAGTEPLIPCWASSARTASRASSCCISDGCPAEGVLVASPISALGEPTAGLCSRQKQSQLLWKLLMTTHFSWCCIMCSSAVFSDNLRKNTQ